MLTLPLQYLAALAAKYSKNTKKNMVLARRALTLVYISLNEGSDALSSVPPTKLLMREDTAYMGASMKRRGVTMWWLGTEPKKAIFQSLSRVFKLF